MGRCTRRLRTVVLVLAIVCNVTWSYFIMHLNNNYFLDIDDIFILVELPYYIGYVVISVALIVFADKTEAFCDSKGPGLVIALAMMLATTLVALLFSQTLLTQDVYVAVCYLATGAVAGAAISYTYLYALRLKEGGAVVATVFIAHVIKRLVALAPLDLAPDFSMLIASYALPAAMTILIHMYKRLGIAHGGKRRESVRPNRASWIVPISVGLMMVGCDSISGTGVWSVGLSEAPANDGMLLLLCSIVIAAALAFATTLIMRRSPHEMKLQPIYLIALSAWFVGSSLAQLGSMRVPFLAEVYFSSISIYAHGMSWVITYWCVTWLAMAPHRAIGIGLITEAASSLLLSSFEVFVPNGAWLCVGALFFLLLIITMAIPSVLKERYQAGQLDDSVCRADLYEVLQAKCLEVAQSYRLSRRETDVLVLLAQGRSKPVICDMLSLSEGTVKTHVTHIYAKMSISSQRSVADIIFGDTRA